MTAKVIKLQEMQNTVKEALRSPERRPPRRCVTSCAASRPGCSRTPNCRGAASRPAREEIQPLLIPYVKMLTWERPMAALVAVSGSTCVYMDQLFHLLRRSTAACVILPTPSPRSERGRPGGHDASDPAGGGRVRAGLRHPQDFPLICGSSPLGFGPSVCRVAALQKTQPGPPASVAQNSRRLIPSDQPLTFFLFRTILLCAWGAPLQNRGPPMRITADASSANALVGFPRLFPLDTTRARRDNTARP